MNKKLWREIGQQKNVTNLILDGMLLNSNSNKSRQGVSSNNVSFDSQKHPIQGNFFDLFDKDISLIGKDKIEFKIQPKRPEQLSIQIQSCQSEPLDSRYDQILHEKEKIKGNRTQSKTKKKVVELHQMVNILAWQLQKMKMGLKLDIDGALSQIILFFEANIMKIKSTYQSKIKQLSNCSSCSENKKQIERLSQQLSQLQQNYLFKQNQYLNLTKQLSKQKEKNQNPLKTIENGLLEQRGEIIRRLKIQLYELQQQNDRLRIELDEKYDDWSQQQRKYKSSLIQMRYQLDSVHQEYEEKLQRSIDQKQILSQNFCILKEKYDELYKEKDKQKLQREIKKKLLFKRQDNALQNLLNPYSQPRIQITKPLKPVQSTKYISNSFKLSPQRQKQTMIIDRSFQRKPSYNYYDISDHQQRIVKKQGKAPINYEFQSPLSSLKSTPKSSLKYIRTVKRYNTNDQSFSQAIEKLNQIHNDVKKQINKTKKSIK